MPKINTTATELSLGFGILGIHPESASWPQVKAAFSDTVSQSTFELFREEFLRSKSKYSQFYGLGRELQQTYSHFVLPKPSVILWEGPTKQANTSTVPCDLRVADRPVSVKDDSDVVRNSSPWNLFEALPRGEAAQDRSENWFSQVALEHYQDIYSLARQIWWMELPESIETYDARAKGTTFWDKDELGRMIPLPRKGPREFYGPYVEFCHVVAERSARIFNENLSQSFGTSKRKTVTEHLLRMFFRLDSQEYVLCGMQGKSRFAIRVPSLNDWMNSYSVRSVRAFPDFNRDQSVVNFDFEYQHKASKELYVAKFQSEIRWSHRKFGGSPEAKIYKKQYRTMWMWTDLPFIEILVPGRDTFSPSRPREMQFVASGGFCEIYRALMPSGEEIALKQPIPALRDAKTLKRFCEEATIQSSLVHPHIVPVVAMDIESQTPWYSMPLAHSNLAEFLEVHSLTLRELISMFAGIVDAVAYAHSQHVIHRDLKPANILIFGEDTPKIADFGSGKQLQSGRQSLTSTGDFVGTLEYAAPEQLGRSREADERTDIFALGLILFEMATGTRYQSISDLSLVDSRLRSIIVTCIEDDPDKRFQRVEELRTRILILGSE